MFASQQLDKRFSDLDRLARQAVRPSRGWVRAMRDGLGMTTAQLAKRMGVSQPRISELEKAELTGSVTLHSLERAAEALGCRVVYALVPVRPLGDVLEERASRVADRQLASVGQTMALEDQAVADGGQRAKAREHMIEALLRKPARLWDDV